MFRVVGKVSPFGVVTFFIKVLFPYFEIGSFYSAYEINYHLCIRNMISILNELNNNTIMRLLIPIGLGLAFLGWFLYRLIIKKDLKKQLHVFYLGLAFIVIWLVIYWLLLKS